MVNVKDLKNSENFILTFFEVNKSRNILFTFACSKRHSNFHRLNETLFFQIYFTAGCSSSSREPWSLISIKNLKTFELCAESKKGGKEAALRAAKVLLEKSRSLVQPKTTQNAFWVISFFSTIVLLRVWKVCAMLGGEWENGNENNSLACVHILLIFYSPHTARPLYGVGWRKRKSAQEEANMAEREKSEETRRKSRMKCVPCCIFLRLNSTIASFSPSFFPFSPDKSIITTRARYLISNLLFSPHGTQLFAQAHNWRLPNKEEKQTHRE